MLDLWGLVLRPRIGTRGVKLVLMSELGRPVTISGFKVLYPSLSREGRLGSTGRFFGFGSLGSLSLCVKCGRWHRGWGRSLGRFLDFCELGRRLVFM